MSGLSNHQFLVLPQSRKGPGVLVLHAWWGLNDFFKDFCRRLAAEGFVVMALDLYHGKLATTVAEAEQLNSGLGMKPAKMDLREAVKTLAGRHEVTAPALGVVGFSMGAFWSLWLAREMPEQIKAVTLFYGAHPADYAAAQAAFLGHFAEKDDWEPVEGVKELEQNLLKAGRPVTFYTYPGTGHWFFESNRPDAYNPAAAQLAWERTVRFLKDELKS